METSVNVLHTIDFIAIVCGLYGAIISIVAFIAAIIFYHHSRNIQEETYKALISIEEKSKTIKDSVGVMSGKMLDTIISIKKDILPGAYEPVLKSIQESENIIKNATSEITGIGKEQKEEINKSVKKEFEEILKKLSTAKEKLDSDVDEVLYLSDIINKSGVKDIILQFGSSNWLDFSDIKSVLKYPKRESNIIELLRYMFDNGLLQKRISVFSPPEYSLTNAGRYAQSMLKKQKNES